MVKIMENPIKMDDLGVPLFLEIPTCFHEQKDKQSILDDFTVCHLGGLPNTTGTYSGAKTLLHYL